MATERTEKRIKKEEDTHELDDNKDRDVISNLPEEVLLHILSLVPTKSAVKTSVLSKRWEPLWARVPSFIARSSNYRNKIVFNKLMDMFTHHRQHTKESVTDFALFTEYHGAKSRVDNWLDSVVSQHLKIFKLHFISAGVDRKKVHLYTFPLAFMVRMHSLEFLELQGIEWPKGKFSFGHFSSLKSLSLEKIFGLTDDHLSSLLSASPSLEELILKNCVDLKNSEIKSTSLKCVKIIQDSCVCRAREIRVQAENVESLVYDRGYSHQACFLALVSCVSIKYLSLSNGSFGDWSLKDLVAALPFLKELVLDSCDNLVHIQIESESLERLVVKKIGHMLERKATINAPKLAFFSYRDQSLMGLTLKCSVNLVAEIEIFAWNASATNYSQQWYANLIHFLANLDTCKELSIWVTTEKALIIPTELRNEFDPPLPTLKHLKVKMENSLFRKRIFKASLGWISPSVETLTIEEKKYLV